MESSVYSKVRNWYLARLRERAREDQLAAAATPGTLILEDQTTLKELVRRASAVRPGVASIEVTYAQGVGRLWVLWSISLLLVLVIVVAYSGQRVQLAVETVMLGLVPFFSGMRATSLEGVNPFLSLAVFTVVVGGLPYLYSLVRPTLVGLGSESVARSSEFARLLCRQTPVPIGTTVLFLGAVATQFAVISEILAGASIPWITSLFPFLLIGLIAYVTCVERKLLLSNASLLIPTLLALEQTDAPLCVPSAAGMESNLVAVANEIAKRITTLSARENLIADFSRDVIVGMTADLKVAAISPNVMQYWKYDPLSLCSNPLAIFVDDTEAGEFRAAAMSAMATRSPQQVVTRIITKGGKNIDLRWTMEWSQTEDLLFACATDISPQRQLEYARQQFLAMITHDLRTPASSVLTSLQLASRSISNSKPERASEQLTKAERLLKRMIDLTDEIIDADKAANGKLVLELRTVDASELVGTAIEDIAPIAEARSLQIKTTVEPLTLYCDSDRIKRVLVNLLANACKYSPTGSDIEVHCRTLEAYVHISVVDRGPGLPGDAKLLVFEPYEQSESTNYAMLAGSGLGLSICKSFVEAHGGRIDVDSVDGGGSEFWFMIPRRAES